MCRSAKFFSKWNCITQFSSPPLEWQHACRLITLAKIHCSTTRNIFLQRKYICAVHSTDPTSVKTCLPSDMHTTIQLLPRLFKPLLILSQVFQDRCCCLAMCLFFVFASDLSKKQYILDADSCPFACTFQTQATDFKL